MEKHSAVDLHGKDLQVGDWVRVLAVPISVRNMPIEAKEAFSNAVGNTFQIEAFGETGDLQLDMWPKVSLDTIWVEPFLVQRYRRYERLSKSFQRRLEQAIVPRPPCYEVKFDIRSKEGADIEEFGQQLTSMGTGGGFAYWPEKRRISGSVHVDKSEPDAMEILEAVRRTIIESEHISIGELSDITELEEI